MVDDVAGEITGRHLANGQITNDNRLTLNGTAERAAWSVSMMATLTLLGVTSATATRAARGRLHADDGVKRRHAHINSDDRRPAAGNVSPATSGFTIVVDITLPTVPRL